MRSLQDFQDATKKGPGIHLTQRGGELAKIDKALAEYHRDGSDRNLDLLLSVCLAWLKEKSKKSSTPPGKRASDGESDSNTNKLFIRRREAVAELANQALTEIGHRGLGYRAGSAHEKYSQRKIAWRAKDPEERSPLKALDAGYALERKRFEQTKTEQKNTSTVDWIVSASGLHAARENIRAYQKDHVDLTHYLRGSFSPKQLSNIVRKEVRDWSRAEIDYVQRLAEKKWSGEVAYLHRKGRYEYMVSYDGNGLLCDQNGHPITTETKHPHQTAYAMDRYGNLFCRDVDGGFTIDRDSGDLKFFNHSSFNAGKGVICAGVLVIVDGVLKSINNMSGHYRPTKTNLIECVKVLRADSVKLNECTVSYFDPAVKGMVAISAHDIL